MQLIRDMTAENAEVTLESNPDNVTSENTKIWRDLGFTRLSIGVQSFDPEGLRDLTRQHDANAALRALELASKHFPKSNGDLIYGWHGQTLESWEKDLKTLVSSGVNHVSLYALTYEGQTPFVRAERRGKREQMSDDELAKRYEVACEELSQSGFRHEEISNWSKDQASCDHNWLYWQGGHYIGLGAGAHGFIDDGSLIGLRYSFPGDFRTILRNDKLDPHLDKVEDLISSFGGQIDHRRDLESWKLEYVGCGLRSRRGVDLSLLHSKGFFFTPSLKIERAIAEKKMAICDNKLILDQKEWFLETTWAFEVCESLKGPSC